MQFVPFRVAYDKMGHLRSFVHCPLLCLTATAGKETRTQIMKALHMRDTKLIKISPDKPNCKFVVKKCPGEVEDELMWVLTELKENKSLFSRTIIFCRSLSSCGQLYSFFKQELDGSLSGMYAMYYSKQNLCISRSIFDIKISFMSVLAFEFHKTLHAAFGQSSARHFTASANIPLKTVCFGPEAYWILT